MIKCEEFVNLNMENREAQMEDEHGEGKDLPQSEVGPDSVSFNVHFSQLALGRRARKQR